MLALEEVHFSTATGAHIFEAKFSILKIQPIHIMVTVTRIFRLVGAVINIPSFLRSEISSPLTECVSIPELPIFASLDSHLGRKMFTMTFFLWHFCPSFPNPFCEEGQENMKITIVQILPTEAAGVGSWRGIAFKTEVAEALIWRERLHNCVATAAWRNTGAHIAQIDGSEN